MSIPPTVEPRPVIHPQRRGETVHRPDPEPVFTALARHWENTGRLVPGRHDEEWTTLINRPCWPCL
ncbi:hypothetical protein ABZ667_43440 [Streptomyces lavendulae]|uniref:hypothetical protein n=1 Tax=Streptomyces lavendulae TaxID=1914 RepID=UPI0033F7ED1B